MGGRGPLSGERQATGSARARFQLEHGVEDPQLLGHTVAETRDHFRAVPDAHLVDPNMRGHANRGRKGRPDVNVTENRDFWDLPSGARDLRNRQVAPGSLGQQIARALREGKRLPDEGGRNDQWPGGIRP